MTQRPVIVDCDNALGVPGCDVDDGLAVLFLLTRPEIALRGVSTCFGNAPLPLVLHATRHRLRGRGVEVLAGAAKPGAPAGEAAHFLLEAARREPGRITVLALGPLTNLAAAARLDPGFPGCCAGVIALGGTMGPAPRLGWRRLRELNFAADPGAASMLLARGDVALTVVPATSCLGLHLDAGTSRGWTRTFDARCAIGSPACGLARPRALRRVGPGGGPRAHASAPAPVGAGLGDERRGRSSRRRARGPSVPGHGAP